MIAQLVNRTQSIIQLHTAFFHFTSLFFLSLFLSPSLTFGGSICDSYKRSSPRMAELYCSSGSSGSTKPAGASSTFSDSFKLNPAGLPTESSPYGIEVMSTFLKSGASPGMPNIGVIKGFRRFGTGVSTSAANTFYANDLVQRLDGPSELQSLEKREDAKGYITDLNLGTSFAVFSTNFLSLQLGLSGRYNKTSNTFGGGPAIMLSGTYLSFGVGMSHEKVSNRLEAANFYSFVVSTRISIFELEYTTLVEDSDPRLDPIQILTISAPISVFILTAAVRRLNYISEGSVTQPHVSIQFLVTKHVSLGYLYNYIPGGNTLGLQVFL